VITEANEMTNSEFVSVLEYDDAAKELRFLSMAWIHREALRPLGVPLDGSAAGWVFRKGQPLIIQDARIDQRHFKAADRIAQYETRSLAAVPLITHGETIGVLEAINKKDGAHYNEEDLAILATLGALAAQAMQNDSLRRKVKSARIELAELERLKTDFIAITSHELRTPLGLILGHATFLRELGGEKYAEQLDTIIRNATKLKEIVENLADVDNYQKGSARVRNNQVSLARIVDDVALTFQDEAKSQGITLSVDKPDSSLYMDADGVKINIALSNLVKNSLQFTDPGGRVMIRAGEESGYLKVAVEDTGIGIPARDLPRVFERFFQVETHLTRRHTGMGLGLAVAKGMIELHGGRIWAESEVGRGSTFTFLLPIRHPQPSETKSKPLTE
jgi:signal transduction histidine kinase